MRNAALSPIKEIINMIESRDIKREARYNILLFADIIIITLIRISCYLAFRNYITCQLEGREEMLVAVPCLSQIVSKKD